MKDKSFRNIKLNILKLINSRIKQQKPTNPIPNKINFNLKIETKEARFAPIFTYLIFRMIYTSKIKTMNPCFAMILFCLLILTNSSLQSTNQQPEVKLEKQVYFHLPQITDQEYSVVKDHIYVKTITNTQQALQKSERFVSSKSGNYFVGKAADDKHQQQKIKELKGKNIFTPAYIQAQILDGRDQLNSLQISSQLEISQFKKLQDELVEQKQVPKPEQKQHQPQINEKLSTKAEEKEEQIEIKQTQLYNEFKQMETLKEKNLRQIIKDNSKQARDQNFMKLVAYISIGLVLSFAIIKKATKSEPKIAQPNQERKQLRLRDTVQEEDQEVSSSDSDQ